jgi:hypothetical protein
MRYYHFKRNMHRRCSMLNLWSKVYIYDHIVHFTYCVVTYLIIL